MTIFHYTDTIILCDLDILDLTANQDWVVSIFFYQAFNNFSQSAALPWGNLLKKYSGMKSFILSFLPSSGLFFSLFASDFSLTLSFKHFFFSRFPVFLLPHLYHQPSQLFFRFPFLWLPYTLLPLFWTTPQGHSCSVWLRTGHSLLFF